MIRLRPPISSAVIGESQKAMPVERAATARTQTEAAVLSEIAPGALSVWDDILEEESEPSTVLILDSVEINRRVLRGMLKNGAHRILEAKRPSEAFDVVARQKVDLVVVDLMMPEMSGPEFCRKLKSERRTQFIPILMLTNVQSVESEVAGISSGADEFLVKPLQPQVVRTRVRAMLRNKTLIDSLEEAETILFALAQSVEQRDRHTGQHCQRLAAYSMMLGHLLGLPSAEIGRAHV